jgi:hypothetical protein
VFIFGDMGWRLHSPGGEFGFGPGMARVRIKRLEAGIQQTDVVVRLCELRPGDDVLDATLGLATDALVCARAVGPGGRVVGFEQSFPIWILVSEGLRTMGPFPRSCFVEARHGASKDLMSRMPSASVDCVLLDPMFSLPAKSSPVFELMRQFAIHAPLDLETIREARRVARRWVVIKGGRSGRDFAPLGIDVVHRSKRSSVVWGRLGPAT